MQATKIDYNDLLDYYKGIGGILPKSIGLERRFRPQFQGLNLGDVFSFLQGGGGQKGVVGQSGRLTRQAGKQIGQARQQEIGQMTGQAGAMRGLLGALSPESAMMVQFANQNAIDAQNRAMGLTGQEARTAQQFAREAGADRGREMDYSTMAAEVLNRDNILAAKRQEAYGATQNAFNLANTLYSQPGLQALSAVPNSYQAGQNYLGIGLNAIGAGRPQMISMDAGLNMAAANAQNATALQGAQAQAKASESSGFLGALGNIAGAFIPGLPFMK